MDLLEELRRREEDVEAADHEWMVGLHELAVHACGEAPDVPEVWRYRARSAWLLGMVATTDDERRERFHEVANAAVRLEALGDEFGAEQAWVDVGAYGYGQPFFADLDERYGVLHRLACAQFHCVSFENGVSVLNRTRLQPDDPRYRHPG